MHDILRERNQIKLNLFKIKKVTYLQNFILKLSIKELKKSFKNCTVKKSFANVTRNTLRMIRYAKEIKSN